MFILALLVLLSIGSVLGYLAVSGRVRFLVLHRIPVEVNGVRMRAELLGSFSGAILTVRGAERDHSYQLWLAGDVDGVGDMGNVVSCGTWVAPRTPFLIATRSYPPCTRLRIDGSLVAYRSVLYRGSFLQFEGDDKMIVKIDITPRKDH
jgi:hypothetical protein